jgi:predicted nucleic acid-binding protein
MTSKPRIWFTPLHRAEWMHAIAQHVFRKEISPAEARRVQAELGRDLASGLWLKVDLPEATWETCADLARRHGPHLDIRTLDSLHVVVALQLGAKAFWTFDDRQAKLAAAEGLRSA